MPTAHSLALTQVKIKGYAGTPGYTAPEMIKNKLYACVCV
jgi:hypothetical protein